MTNRPARPLSIAELQRTLLDASFNRAMALIYQAMGRDFARTGILGKLLTDLEAKAKDLEADGKQLTLDTPELRVFLGEYERSLKSYAGLLNAIAEPVQTTGATAGLIIAERVTLAGLAGSALAQRWKRPGNDVLLAALRYVAKPEFRKRVDDYPSAVVSIVAGLVRGKNPVAIARDIRRTSVSLSAYQANSLMRTLQLTAYRDATAISYVTNADILEPVSIRIAALQVGRTCLACVALHGTEIPLGSRVDDHDNGRCTSIAVVRGRPRNIQNGVAWFNGLTANEKRTIAGPGKLEAINRGDALLSDFVGQRVDPIFGPMIEELSLKQHFGPAAKDYYQYGARSS